MTQRDNQRDKLFTRRALLLGSSQLALVGALVGRLYYLQVVEADRYVTLSDENRINLKLLPPPRGRMFDRFGEALATDRLTYRAVIVAEQARTVGIDGTLDALGEIIEVSDGDRRRVLRDVKRKRAFVPVAVREDLTWEDVAKVEVNSYDLPGVSIEVGHTRFYPHTEAVGHILGYVGAVSEAELKGSDDPLLELPDFRIGKNGLEKQHDADLRGTAGSSQVEVNAVGRVIRELNRVEGKAGKDVELTLDIGLQEFTRRQIADESAACVLLDIHSGEILAMVSAPAFDPNVFSVGLNARDWEAFLANPKTPLINKAIAGLYPPGSTFKMITGLAALDAGIITADTRITCAGHTTFGNRLLHCWNRNGHGSITVQDAVKQSCDIFFFETARRLGIDKLSEMAKRFGLGNKVGIDLPGEKPGIIPSRDWYMKTHGKSWPQGETLNAGIGQGFIVISPLQLATMIARFANGGRAVVPHLTRRVGGKRPEDAPNQPFPSLGIKQASLDAILRGMAAVVNEPHGTAYPGRITEAGFEMGGKTGSAQVRHLSAVEAARGGFTLSKNLEAEIPWRERDHALFMGFAPVSAPRFACGIVVEHGLHPGISAVPIVHAVLLEAQKRYLPGDTAPSAQNVSRDGRKEG
jgi:penicillin-binding protein 2